MTDFTTWNEWIGVDVSVQQALAIRFLERHGLKYMVHFGYGNAIQKAREIAANAPKNRDQLFSVPR